MRVLCLAAHPDDETLGCGGTLLKHRAAGDEVHLLVATVAYAPRWSEALIAQKRKECTTAAEILGVREIHYLGFRTMHLRALPAIELSDAVERVVRAVRPDTVYAPPCDDINTDHASLFDAALVATRPVGGDAPTALYSYEIPTTTRFNYAARWTPNTYVDIGPHLDQKLQAMRAYRSELREPPHPRSLEAIRVFARERGMAMGLAAAEAHMLIRALR